VGGPSGGSLRTRPPGKKGVEKASNGELNPVPGKSRKGGVEGKRGKGGRCHQKVGKSRVALKRKQNWGRGQEKKTVQGGSFQKTCAEREKRSKRKNLRGA